MSTNALTSTAGQTGSSVMMAPEKNAWEDYGEQFQRGRIVGDLLKFSKGDWTAGKPPRDVPIGTKLMVDMSGMTIGWVRWMDGKPTESITGKVADRFQKPGRSTLGDDDKTAWELDTSNQPRDPWQDTSTVCMVDGNGDVFTFSTSSKGGRDALGDLVRVFGPHVRAAPDEYPVVALGVDKYQHPDKQRGVIKTPTLKVVGWAKASIVAEALEKEAANAAADAQARKEQDGAADDPWQGELEMKAAAAAGSAGGGAAKKSNF